jgi:hypothetical protein
MSALAHIAHPAHIALYLSPVLFVLGALRLAGRYVTDEVDDPEDDDV